MLQEKIISQILDPNRGVSSILELQNRDIGSQNSKGWNFSKISGSFQTGGIPESDGRYLVGENGPEIVKLPKGSAVIPLNISDLIEGLRKFPELSNFIKGEDLQLFADPEDPSILTGNKGKVSLAELEKKYEDFSKNTESDGIINKEILDQIKEQRDLLKDLKSMGQKKIENSIKNIETERDKILKGYGENDLENYRNLVSKLIEAIPKNYLNPLVASKMDLIAAKSVEASKGINYRDTEESVISGKPKKIMDSLNLLNKPKDNRDKEIFSKEMSELSSLGKTKLEEYKTDSDVAKKEGSLKNEESQNALKVANYLISSTKKNSEFDLKNVQESFLENIGKYSAKNLEGEIIKSPSEILGSFKTGGLATLSGDYLVGENGPELIKNVLTSGSLPTAENQLGNSKILKSQPNLSTVQGNLLSIIDNKISPNPINPLSGEEFTGTPLQKSTSLNSNLSSYLVDSKFSNTDKGLYPGGLLSDLNNLVQVYAANPTLKKGETMTASPAELKNTITPLTEAKKETSPSINESIDKLKDGLVDVFKKREDQNMSTKVSGESDKSQPLPESSTTQMESRSQPGEPGKSESPKDLQNDLADIKTLLSRISSLLEGPLEVSTIESPFRPDSRKV